MEALTICIQYMDEFLETLELLLHHHYSLQDSLLKIIKRKILKSNISFRSFSLLTFTHSFCNNYSFFFCKSRNNLSYFFFAYHVYKIFILMKSYMNFSKKSFKIGIICNHH